MKKLIILVLVIIISSTNFLGCQDQKTNSPTDKLSDITDEDDPIIGIMNLYAATSNLTTTSNNENLNEIGEEINSILNELNNKNMYNFSKEAKELIDEINSSAKNAIKYRKLFIENEQLGDFKKSSEFQQKSFSAITEMAEIMVKYGELYDNFKSNSNK